MATTDSEKDEEMEARDAEARAEDAEAEAAEADREDADDEGSDDEGSDDEGSDDEGSDDESSDDESSDDEGSDDESSDDDEGSDDDESSDDEAGARVAGRAKSAEKGKARRRGGKGGMSAGARLAAAKAAKAARKAAKRGKEKKAQDPLTQMRESALAQRAEQAGSWAKDNRNALLVGLAVLVLGVAGWMGWRYHEGQQAQAAATLLQDAVEIADAEIVPADEDEHAGDAAPARDAADEDEAPTFPTEQARSEAALTAYRRVLSQYPGSTAAPWARLGEARALFELGHNDQAREAYEKAITEGGSDSAVVWRALEGKGFTFEAEEHWDQALEVYQELSRVDDGRFDPVAKYHMARMYLAKDDRERATETLRALVDHLREAADDEQAQDFAYVLAQAQVRLRELDPSAVPAAPAGLDSPFGAGSPTGLGQTPTQEQIQEFLRRLQEQQGQGGGAPPAGE